MIFKFSNPQIYDKFVYLCENFDSMLEDFRLKVFITLASAKSFTKAAAQLGVSQPAVSQHVSELEKQLNVKLFERQRGETVLTSAGRVFLSYAGRILSDYHDIEVLFAPVEARIVKVAASEEIYDYLVSDMFADFITVHPQVTFMKSFQEDADLVVSLVPDNKKRGTFALSFSPSESFATTKVYRVLSESFKPSFK